MPLHDELLQLSAIEAYPTSSDVEFSTPSSTVRDSQPSLEATNTQPSSLWTLLNECERREIADSNISYNDLEVMHDVRQSNTSTRNTCRDPMKVCTTVTELISLGGRAVFAQKTKLTSFL